ncbi:MAG: DUF448 domain-containing protein [Desulfovibrionaceae bacterium]|nr:DUF448 domain-containing protein [Desulfovibrionaceae bacterium]
MGVLKFEHEDGPIRMCIICRKRFLKRLLRRYVKMDDGQFFLDAQQNMAGRGWYLCSDTHCEQRFQQFRAGSRAKRG